MSDTDLETKEAEKGAESSGDGKAQEGGVQDKPAAPKDKKAKTSKALVSIDNYVINSEAPAETYNNGPVKAYHAGLDKNGGTGMFALVCEKHYSPRIRDIEKYASVMNGNCLTLKKRGVVYWPPAEQERYVFIYNGKIGSPLMERGKVAGLGLKQEFVIEHVARPLINLIYEFEQKGFFHGGIRADNIFDGGNRELKNIVVGDCLAVPPSSTQPVVYEPIYRAMADPLARGLGTTADDLYALGVTIAVLMRGQDPLAGMTDSEITKFKLEHGSYAAVTGKDRFTGSILELLRGLLNDEVENRWTLEEIFLWLDGRRLSPKQSTRDKKAIRPFVFNKKSYYHKQTLAMDLQTNPFEAVQVAEDGSLLQWVERALEDNNTLEKLEEAIVTASAKGRGGDYNERMVSMLSIALDPQAPARYKGLNMRGGGVGASLSRAVALNQDVNPFVDLFLQDIIFKWLGSYEGGKLDTASLIQKYDSCKRSLRQGTMGHGIERCVYILNDEAHCYSEKLTDYYVTSPEELLETLERMCARGDVDGLILDRHMVAFVSKNDGRVVDPYLFDLNSSEYYKNVLGNLKCLAAMQERYNAPSLPGIARVIQDMLPVVLKRFHDKEVRDKLREGTKRYAKAGDLVKMSALINNPQTGKQDYQTFLHAVKEYADLRKSYEDLEDGIKNTDQFGRGTGQDVAAVFASLISLLIIIAVGYSYMSGGGVGL